MRIAHDVVSSASFADGEEDLDAEPEEEDPDAEEEEEGHWSWKIFELGSLSRIC